MTVQVKSSSSAWRALLGACLCLGFAFGLLVVYPDAALAQPNGPDAAVVFLVDESTSLTGNDREYVETLYDATRFINGSLNLACESRECQTAVWRFSADPVELVSLKNVHDWDEVDNRILSLRALDRLDQSDFPTAIDAACKQLRYYPEDTKRVVVLLTDGQLGTPDDPSRAPIQRDQPTSRDSFVAAIDRTMDDCVADRVELIALLLPPAVRYDQSGQLENDGDAGTQEGSGDGLVRSGEIDQWETWAGSTGGNVIQSDAPDRPLAIEAVIQELGESLALTMPTFVRPEDGLIDLGMVTDYRESADFTLLALKPFQWRLMGPDGTAVQTTKNPGVGNRAFSKVSFPKAGRWAARIAESAEDNIFVVHPPLSRPMRLQVSLTANGEGYPRLNIPDDGTVGLQLYAQAIGAEDDSPIALPTTFISGTVTSPMGLALPITFTADSTQGVYIATLAETGGRLEPGLYSVVLPQQAVADSVVEEAHEQLVLVDEPFITHWSIVTPEGQVVEKKPLVLIAQIADMHLLTTLPEFEISWKNGNNEITTLPNDVVMVDRTREIGSYQIDVTSPSADNYEMSVHLKEGMTSQGTHYDNDESTTESIEVLPAPPLNLLEEDIPPVSSKPAWWILAWNMKFPLGGLFALLIVVASTGLIVVLFRYVAPDRPIRFRDSPENDELAGLVGLERRYRLRALVRRVLHVAKAADMEEAERTRKAAQERVCSSAMVTDEGIYNRRRLSWWRESVESLGSRSPTTPRDGEREMWWKFQLKMLSMRSNKIKRIAVKEFDRCAEEHVFSSPYELFAEATQNGSIWDCKEFWGDD